MGGEAVSAARPTKTPFAFFDCPKCKYQSAHAWLYTKSLQTYAWCEGCSSYFEQKNSVLFGLVWGGFFAPLVIALIMAGPLAPWMQDFGRIGLLGVAAVIALPILAFTLPYFVRWTIRYEYMGRNAP